MKKSNTWFSAPSLSIVLLVLFAWLIGTTCSLLAMTNFLSETPFRKGNTMMWYLIISSSICVLLLSKNYLKTSIKKRRDNAVES